MAIHEQEIFAGISEFETLRIFFGFVLFLFLFRIPQIIRKRACSNGLLARNAYFDIGLFIKASKGLLLKFHYTLRSSFIELRF